MTYLAVNVGMHSSDLSSHGNGSFRNSQGAPQAELVVTGYEGRCPEKGAGKHPFTRARGILNPSVFSKAIGHTTELKNEVN